MCSDGGQQEEGRRVGSDEILFPPNPTPSYCWLSSIEVLLPHVGGDMWGTWDDALCCAVHNSHEAICGWLRTDVSTGEVSINQVLDEGCLAHAVLPKQQHLVKRQMIRLTLANNGDRETKKGSDACFNTSAVSSKRTAQEQSTISTWGCA